MAILDHGLASRIVDRAQQFGVEPDIALAYAIAESNVSNVRGDLSLWKRHGYLAKVAKHHPAIYPETDPSDWVSYGPFQLQALWFLHDGERPEALLEERVNLARGLSAIARLTEKYGAESQARLAYVCGAPDSCSEEKAGIILRRFRAAKYEARNWLDKRPVDGEPLVAGTGRHGDAAAIGAAVLTLLALLKAAQRD